MTTLFLVGGEDIAAILIVMTIMAIILAIGMESGTVITAGAMTVVVPITAMIGAIVAMITGAIILIGIMDTNHLIIVITDTHQLVSAAVIPAIIMTVIQPMTGHILDMVITIGIIHGTITPGVIRDIQRLTRGIIPARAPGVIPTMLHHKIGVQMRKIMLLIVLSGGWLLPTLSHATGPEFSADVVMINLKDQSERAVGKLYVGNFRQRKEMMVPDRATGQMGQVIQIVNPQRQAMWQVFPEKKQYWEWTGKIPMEQPPLPGDSRHVCAQGKDRGVSCKQLGNMNLSGRETDKWELSFTRDGKTMQSLVWIDPKLGMPIREEMANMGAMELRNIKEGPQPDNLFEIPAGFEKTAPPQGHGPGPGGPSPRMPQGTPPQ